jgi:EAL domain-containing protein (putative c-di-GMP-specific phosphodiesterase class I)
VFSEICRQLAEWGGRGFAPRISFNVPAQQLRSSRFADFVIATAHRDGIDLACVAAEITETSPISLDEVMPTLTRLRDAGFSLSLDDFGTGYSSLARLRTLPFSVLKTDRSFLAGVPGDATAGKLLRGIIALGATLGLEVIVEGVETSEQERELVRLGARVAQGYHLGTPAPAAVIEAQWGSGEAPVAEPPVILAAGQSRSSPVAHRTPPPRP